MFSNCFSIQSVQLATSTVVFLAGVLPCLGHSASAVFAQTGPQQFELFEKSIRPVLAEKCYACHNSHDAQEGGLSLDDRQGLRKGGDSGVLIQPGSPDQSRLIRILRHEIEGLEMPQDGPKLSDQVIQDFEKWIASGAPDPRDHPPNAEELRKVTSWEATLEKRKQWWCWQPLAPIRVHRANADQPSVIDRLVNQRLEQVGLSAAPQADRVTLIRRASFAITGLPPTPSEIDAFLGDPTPDAYARMLDRYLDSPRFGERWARHWMDWIRYADSHGSEGDPEIVGAWQYRDYLIRAFRADVPLDQLIREHIAGDLLETPRLNEELELNESVLGTAHWRMVFHGFAPTDALDEKVRFTDDQINVFSKAFLGVTVACARCHNHKFDAISQADYYALFGILGSTRPGRAVIDTPERQVRHQDELLQLKAKVRSALAEDWQSRLNLFDNVLDTVLDDQGEQFKQALKQPDHWLHSLTQVDKDSDPTTVANVWRALQTRREQAERQASSPVVYHWKLGGSPAGEVDNWFAYGNGSIQEAVSAGDFAIRAAGDLALWDVYPAGRYSHLLSDKHAARLTSPDFRLEGAYEVWLKVRGSGNASVRYVVQNYPRNGTVYPVRALNREQAEWVVFDLSYWQGDSVHLELTHAQDAPLLVKNENRSWFGVEEVRVVEKGTPRPSSSATLALDALLDAGRSTTPSDRKSLVAIYRDALTTALDAWTRSQLSDAQASLLSEALRSGVFVNRLEQLPRARPLIDAYRTVEAQVPVVRRAPSLDEWRGHDQHLFARGNHKNPQQPIPRRFLEAIDNSPYESQLSGRLELAEDVLDPLNPLTRRVFANRVWHHLFGRGLVSTPDNFGKLGDTPSHPELLDELAGRWDELGWSLKRMIRMLLLTEAWQRSSVPPAGAAELDPENQLWSHANIRRLEAEAIRDSLLATSGQLDERSFGPPVSASAARRSVYLRVKRNDLNPFLRVFDFPEPFSATGRRHQTNVPAQALTMLNDPMVAEAAQAWASRIVATADNTSTVDRIESMFRAALGRSATSTESEQAAEFVRVEIQREQQIRDHRNRFTREIEATQDWINKQLTPVRTRLLSQQNAAGDASLSLNPTGHWEFNKDERDSVHGWPARLHGDARLEQGALVLGGSGYALATIPHAFHAKTLAAWVQLTNDTQRGGGVVSLQSRNGSRFDAIVFGERDPRQWLAGSNFFERTQPLGGQVDSDVVNQPVHVAVVYHEDGRIAAFRNGRAYGKAYQSSGPLPLSADDTVVTFGLRHLPPAGNRYLQGRVLQAQLFDRALTPEELARLGKRPPGYISQAEVLNALTTDKRTEVQAAIRKLSALQEQAFALPPESRQSPELTGWTQLAQALYCLKEFIFIP